MGAYRVVQRWLHLPAKPDRCKPLFGLLSTTQKILRGHSDVLCDPAKQNWRDIAAGVEWNGRASAVGVTELLMRTTLTHFAKAERLQKSDHFSRLEHRQASQSSWHRDLVDSDELSFAFRLAILQ
jgi:hypothetical protein